MDHIKGFDGINIKMEALDDQLSYPDLGLPSTEMFASSNALFMGENSQETGSAKRLQPDDNEDDDDEDDDVIILHIDIRDPIRMLRTMLETRIGVDLSNYEFWLQDAQQLEPHKNLVDQCVKGEGLVQVNAQVRINTKRINIVDVLKPMDDATIDLDEDAGRGGVRSRSESPVADAATLAAAAAIERELSAVPGHTEDSNDVNTPIDLDEDDSNLDAPPPQKPQWIIDTQFKKEQSKLKISEDPRDWTPPQVKHWLQWAIRQFNLTNIKMQDWSMTGKELYDMTLEEFHQKVPVDPDNIFFTHLELLRRLKVAAIPGELSDHDDYNEDMKELKPNRTIIGGGGAGGRPMLMKSTFKPLGLIAQYGIEAPHQGNRTGNNGQIQLWQFLLEILTDREHTDIISWIGTGGQGEFKLSDPERVARLWGERKNKPTMNYEKLSRALRYYYDGDMISKVHGKRFVYKFVCDLTQLIGYSAQELANLVNQPASPTASDINLFNSLKDFVAD